MARAEGVGRADGAGGTHGLIDWIRSGGGNKKFTWHYSLGFTVTEDLEKLIAKVPRLAWRAAMNVANRPIGDTWVVEICGRTGLEDWPDDMRLIIRRSRIHPRDKKLTAYEKKTGWRYNALVTNTPNGPGRDEVWLEAGHRSHTHVEAAIKSAKQTGLRRMPSREFAINHAWCQAVAIATDLTVWLQQLALDGEESRAEPDTVRLRILDIPARLVRGGRRRILKLADDWPWSRSVADAFTHIQALPAPS
ncbi:transposase [Streptomyces sp. NPDC001978]|uniref:transposase n=1 Tax=Streptomyces sp. NPDC001978 TaxID=3364627 RepID=UPI0036CADC49